jgi:probable rRNA maturation factor
VLVGDECGRRVSAPGLARWVARVAPADARGTVSIALVSDARVRALNRQYRHVDRVTDVLSFPTGREPKAVGQQCTGRPLGDIVIARGVARRQAMVAGHSEVTELRILALHGLLHLLGYDHEQDEGRMQRTELRLRRKGGLREGLIERNGRPRRRYRLVGRHGHFGGSARQRGQAPARCSPATKVRCGKR